MKDKVVAISGIIVAVCMVLLGLFILPVFILKCVLGFFMVVLGTSILSHHLGNLYSIMG